MIDFILAAVGAGAGAGVGNEIKGEWEVKRHTVVDNLIAGKGDMSGWTGRWSDHRAVFVEIRRGGGG